MTTPEEESNREPGRAVALPQGRPPVATDLERVGVAIKLRPVVHYLPGAHRGSGPLNALALGPDGRTLYTGSTYDHVARAWDVATGRPLHAFVGHTSGISALVLSRDGRTLVTGSNDRTVRVWNAATGQLLRVLADKSAEALALHPDGRIAFAAGFKGVNCWDIVTGQLVRTLVVHHDEFDFRKFGGNWREELLPFMAFTQRATISAMAVTADGRFLFTGSGNGAVHAWDINTGDHINGFSIGTGRAVALALTPDDRILMVGGDRSCSVEFRDARTGGLLHEVEAKRDVPNYGIHCLAVAPDGKTLFAGSTWGTVETWDVATGKPREIVATVGMYRHLFNPIGAVVPSPDGRTLFTGSWDGIACSWDLTVARNGTDGRLKCSYASPIGYVSAVILSPYRKTLFVGGNDNLQALDTGSGRPFRNFAARSAALSPNGSTLYTGSADGNTYALDALTGQPLGAFPRGPAAVVQLALCAEGRTLLAGYADGLARVFDTSTGQLLRAFELEKDARWKPILSADGRTLLASAKPGIQVWDVATGRALLTHEEHDPCAISANSRILYTTSSRGSLYVVHAWDLASGSLLRTFNGDAGRIAALTLSSDNHVLFTGHDDKEVRAWDTSNGQLLRTFVGHEGGISYISLSPDDRTLFSYSWTDRSLRVWDTPTGSHLVSLYRLEDGFLWTTPRDEVAPSGWFWTDRPDLITVYRADDDGSEREVLADDDPERLKYIKDYNRQDIVMGRLNGSAAHAALKKHLTQARAGVLGQAVPRLIGRRP